jgi:hypothetical protein
LSANPDISSGIATAISHHEYLSIDLPLGIAGTSAGSNGSSAFEVRSGRTQEKESTFSLFSEMNKKAGFGYHHSLPEVTLISLGIVDAYLRVKERMEGAATIVDRQALLKAVEFELSSAVAEPMRSQMAAVIEKHFGVKLRLEAGEIAESLTSGENRNRSLGFRQRQSSLIIDARRFECHDISSVAQLCEKMIAPQDAYRRLHFPTPPSPQQRAREAVKALLGRVSDPQWF